MTQDKKAPPHVPKKERENYIQFGLKLVPLLQVLMLLVALYHLGFADGGLIGWLKLAFIGVAAYTVGYLIDRMAIEKGTTLNSVGYRTAGYLGFVSILIVGIAFFSATASGFAILKVEEFRLALYNQVRAADVSARLVLAASSSELGPVVVAIADDLEAKAECEAETSCVSGRGNGGYGTASRMLETLAKRARGIAGKIEAGLAAREQIRSEVTILLSRMDETLANEGENIWTRRAQLRKLDGHLSQLLNRLDEAVPVALVTSYAHELRSGVTVPNRPVVSDTINRFLAGYAGSIETAVAGAEASSLPQPEFPSRTGVLDTFAYAAKFAPIFLLAFIVDIMFPIALWAYTIMGLDYHEWKRNPDPTRGRRKRSDIDELTELKPFDLRRRFDRDT